MTQREREVRRDYHELSQYFTVSDSHDWRRLTIEDYSYPDGWEPQVAPLLIRYPEHYPRMQPAVYIPKNLRYTQGPVEHRHRCDLDGWVRWCTYYLRKEDYTVFTLREEIDFLDIIRQSLNHPGEDNPVKHASERAQRGVRG